MDIFLLQHVISSNLTPPISVKADKKQPTTAPVVNAISDKKTFSCTQYFLPVLCSLHTNGVYVNNCPCGSVTSHRKLSLNMIKNLSYDYSSSSVDTTSLDPNHLNILSSDFFSTSVGACACSLICAFVK